MLFLVLRFFASFTYDAEIRGFYRNSYIIKVLSKFACELDGFEKSAFVHGHLEMYAEMCRQLHVLQLHA
jgi:hypothetical protein